MAGQGAAQVSHGSRKCRRAQVVVHNVREGCGAQCQPAPPHPTPSPWGKLPIVVSFAAGTPGAACGARLLALPMPMRASTPLLPNSNPNAGVAGPDCGAQPHRRARVSAVAQVRRCPCCCTGTGECWLLGYLATGCVPLQLLLRRACPGVAVPGLKQRFDRAGQAGLRATPLLAQPPAAAQS